MATSPAPSAAAPRSGSLTDWLRRRSDEQLADLLRRRPDLALPAPSDLAMLAGRLSVRTSVQRAVDGLDAFCLHVLEALVITSGDAQVSVPAAAQLLGHPAPLDLDRAIDELTSLGLIWGEPASLHIVATVRDALGPYPAGLGRPAAALLAHVSDVQLAPVLRSLGLPPATQPRAGSAIADVLADPDRVTALIDEVDATEREVLERLAAGSSPVGTVRNAYLPAAWPTAEPIPPPHRLMMRGLLVPIDAQSVELPREVALALRSAPLGEIVAAPPDIQVVVHGAADLDRLGTSAVLGVIRKVDALADAWAAQPPAMLRAGGLGVRDLRRAARDLGTDESGAALVIETSFAAGLIAATSGIEPLYLPTPDYDAWHGRDTAERWAELAAAWLGMTRQPNLVSQRGDRDRLITALGPDAERGTTPAQRMRVLDVLTGLPPGSAPAARAEVLTRLAWEAPRRAAAQRALAEAVLNEADALGVTAAGGLTGYSRTLLDGSRAAAQRALTDALPQPVDHFLVQPDLTVVVPGPPTAELADELALAADLESTGGAYVYRITEASVRRALDAGRGGAELAAFLTERSRTPLPQALSYLIADVARRHGVLRTGTASAYLRCADDAMLSRVLADRDVATLQLRRIAPTVAVSGAAVGRVLDVLRQAGYAPAAEAADGEVVALGSDPPRAPSRTPVRAIRPRASLESMAHTMELVRRIRSGDTLTEISRRVAPVVQQVPGVTSATTMALLRQAIREGRRVLLGHVEPDGTASRSTILPISLAGGFVRGHESASQRLQSFPLHRLTAVSILAEDVDDDARLGEPEDDPA